MVVGASLLGFLDMVGGGVRRHGEDRRRRPVVDFFPIADGAGGRKPAHDRHLEVHQHKIVFALGELRHRLTAILGEGDLHAAAGQQQLDHAPVHRVVLGDQQAEVLNCRLGVEILDRHGRERPQRGNAVTRQRHHHFKCRAFAFLRRRLDRAVHQIDQALDDGEAKAKPAITARGRDIGLLKAFEDPLGDFGCKADAGVADRKVQQCLTVIGFLHGGRDADLAGICELDRIVEQIAQHLADPDCVAAEDAVDAGGDEAIEFEIFGFGPHPRRLTGLAHRLFEFERADIELDVVALKSRELQEIVHHPQERAT